MKITDKQLLCRIKQRCEEDFEFFVRYFFSLQHGAKFRFSWHHHEITKALMRVFNGETTHLIINMPPRYSKTELVVKMFTAWCFMKNPSCEFIHLSYSEALALDNSNAIRDLIKSQEFQQLWPIGLCKDAANAWKTTESGVFLARAAGGQVTGYGAGKVDDFEDGRGFCGCFPYDEIVETDAGFLKIGDISENCLPVRVRSYNEETGEFEWQKIDRYWINPPNEILEIGLSNGDVFRCTPNHEILTRRGWKRADELTPSDRLVRFADALDNAERNIKEEATQLPTQSFIGSDGDFFRGEVPAVIPRRVGKVCGHTAPGFAQLDLSDNAVTDAVPLLKDGDGIGARENLPNLLAGQFGSRAPFENRERPVAKRILHILGFGAVRKIFKAVIKMVAVKVAAFNFWPAWANKGRQNGLVDEEGRDFAVDGGLNQKVAVPVLLWLKDLAFKGVSLFFGNDFTVKAFHAAHVADHVKSLESGNVAPLFVRKIGHVDRTYCLQVRNTHNFTVSKTQIVVSNCILIDDPLKPTDAHSETLRENINRRWDAVIKSRFNSPRTPCIVIMQRIHEEDFCGMLLKDEEYHFEQLILPAILDEGTDHERALWPEKHTLERLKAMASKNSYVFAGQYQQRPTPLGGGILKGAWFKRYTVAPKMKWRAVFVDTAQKEKESNDYQVAECWGLGEDNNLYLLDMFRDKFEAWELERRIPDFWAKQKADRRSPLRRLFVEDKSSGTELIQRITRGGAGRPRIPVQPIERSRSKLERVMDVQGFIQAGYVYLPDGAPFVNDFIAECEAFTKDDTHLHDDQIDPMCDAISQMLDPKVIPYSEML